jgi:hypothetical protein
MAWTGTRAHAHNATRPLVCFFFRPMFHTFWAVPQNFYYQILKYYHPFDVATIGKNHFLCLKSGSRIESTFERHPDPDSHLKCWSGSVDHEKVKFEERMEFFLSKDFPKSYCFSFSFKTPDPNVFFVLFLLKIFFYLFCFNDLFCT